VEEPGPWLGLGALAVLLGSSLGGLALHRWSLVVVRALYRRVHHERLAFVAELGIEPTSGGYEGVGAERQLLADSAVKREFLPIGFAPKKESLRLFHRPCAWCGHFLAPVLCANCKSIQWGSLEQGNLADVLPPWNWAAAVFVAEHRFRLLQVVALVVVAGVLGLGAEGSTRIRGHADAAKATREAERSAADLRARDAGRQVIESAVSLRAAMLTVEAACGDLSAGLDVPACRTAFDRSVESYYRLSWFAPPVLEHLRGTWCVEEDLDVRRAAACERLRQPLRDPVRDNDDRFRRYWDALWSGETGASRAVAAWNLYGGSREVACLVSWFVWNAEASPAPWTDVECQTLVREGWTDQDNLPPCGYTVEQQQLPGASWACWEHALPALRREAPPAP
jgi:hypothetical protein